jgi:ribosomal protein L37AE/L43A
MHPDTCPRCQRTNALGRPQQTEREPVRVCKYCKAEWTAQAWKAAVAAKEGKR